MHDADDQRLGHAGPRHAVEQIKGDIRVAGKTVTGGSIAHAPCHRLHHHIDPGIGNITCNLRVVQADVVALRSARLQHGARLEVELVHVHIRRQTVCLHGGHVFESRVVEAKLSLKERLGKATFDVSGR